MIELYKNIKNLREQMGLSQDELAKLTGYTNRSSIAKIEKGEVDLTRSKIIAFAKALNTTPAKLMGWEKSTDTNETTKKDFLINAPEGDFDDQNKSALAQHDDISIDVLLKEHGCGEIEKSALIAWLSLDSTIRSAVLDCFSNVFAENDSKAVTNESSEIIYPNFVQNIKSKVAGSAEYFSSPANANNSDYLESNAAHARTDIEIPEGADTSDDDIMNDPNF